MCNCSAEPAYAAPGCRVDYTVANQWSGGFQASVTLVNVGDPLNGWKSEEVELRSLDEVAA